MMRVSSSSTSRHEGRSRKDIHRARVVASGHKFYLEAEIFLYPLDGQEFSQRAIPKARLSLVKSYLDYVDESSGTASV